MVDVLGRAREIPRVRDLSLLRFRLDYLARSRPVVMEQAAAHWPALRTWRFEALRARVGTSLVSTYRVRDGHLVFEERAGLVPDRIPLSVFLDELEGRAPLVHRVRADLDRELAPLGSDIMVPPHARSGPRGETNLWMSGPRTLSRLHFDQPHNVLVQVTGDKRVVLFHPRDRRNLYPESLTSASAQFSRVDLHAPDLERHPRLQRARPLATLLAPGDALFIPGGWWHYLEADDATVSVGFRFWPITRIPLLLAAAIYKRVRGFTR